MPANPPEPTTLVPSPRPLKSCLSKTNLRDLDGSGSERGLMKRNVSFCQIEIREYEQTLVDNPCVTKGPPIGLDWNYEECGAFHVDDYELHRGANRRSRSMMMVPSFVREKQLRQEWDVTKAQIQKMKRKVNKQKRERYVSSNNSDSLEKSLDVFNTAKRKIKKRLSFLNLVKKKGMTDEELLRHYSDMVTASSSKRKNRVKSCNDLQLMAAQQELLESTNDENEQGTTSVLLRKPMCKSMVNLSTFNTLEEDEDKAPPDDASPVESDKTEDTDDDWGFDLEEDTSEDIITSPFLQPTTKEKTVQVEKLPSLSRSLDSSQRLKNIL
mmetsp:Transcript_29008/g.43830  ORF Transcript_29008/g.43830 Transcript_29008/m.43830 type:complete len:326 (+) Transcript_29008:243-1220(+)|eukprot:CAMPEP_0178916606 /NCGR_PEP_ID=MMETSP0786-20121207/12749_1 /TAXON_ID=186022 /ORGANISM="Thalassionema frauenfeldii, Strain CCMP 1798" /LENGTH=325 /DNA_ID=CAMNT_0020589993 /DNA_START=224 /DNA_END=1201 /DNA_ORIENTATION=+